MAGIVERIKRLFSPTNPERTNYERWKREQQELMEKALKGEYGKEALIAGQAISILAKASEQLEGLNRVCSNSPVYQLMIYTTSESIPPDQIHIKDLLFSSNLEIDSETSQFLSGGAFLQWTDLTPYKLPGLRPRQAGSFGKQEISVSVQSGVKSANPMVLIEDNKRKNPVEISLLDEEAQEKVIEFLEEWVRDAMDLHFKKIEGVEKQEYYSSGAWRIYGPYKGSSF